MKNKVMNYEIEIWYDADCRDEGFSDKVSPEMFNLETLEEIKEFVEEFYVSQGIEADGGSIEISLTDENGQWVKSLYHISEDSDDKLEEVK